MNTQRGSRAQRAGMTIIELLVAISVLAMLLAIAIPAVLTVRESSRRTQCQSRLRDLGVALAAFEAARRYYPECYPATSPEHDPWPSSHQPISPHVYLLPYLDQAELGRQFDLRVPVPFSVNPERDFPEAWRARLAVFLCPSDDPSTGGTNYRACLGPTTSIAPENRSGRPEGVFVPLKRRRAADVRDGASRTIAMAEKLKSPPVPHRFSPADYWYTGAYPLVRRSLSTEETISVCGALRGEPQFFFDRCGATWVNSAYDYTLYNHAVGPNASIPDCSTAQFEVDRVWHAAGVYKASSHHPGGVQVLFLDGHVAFIADGIDLTVWRALSSIAGAEVDAAEN